jgi:hypothetical protein
VWNNLSVADYYMKYFSVSEAGLAIELHCVSERYSASSMDTLSPMEKYPVQRVPWLGDVTARDPGGLRCRFMRGTRRPVRDGAASSPGARNLPIAILRG